jgi:NAD(P)-dependent dehydrogenase (short-subunit alcohol dehydrogenase family)
VRLDGRLVVAARDWALPMRGSGAAVVVNDIGCAVDGTGEDEEVANGAAAAITALGGKVKGNSINACSENGASAIIDCATQVFGRIDILVNSAGIDLSTPIDALQRLSHRIGGPSRALGGQWQVPSKWRSSLGGRGRGVTSVYRSTAGVC